MCKGFTNLQAMLIEEDEELERQKATYTVCSGEFQQLTRIQINGEVRRTTNWAVGNYKPSALTQEKLAAYAAQAPRHPKPVKNETQVEVYKKWTEKYHKMQPEEQRYGDKIVQLIVQGVFEKSQVCWRFQNRHSQGLHSLLGL